jgi:thiamine pyrophosphate-dependent acetolactate synthase large subunit-like protein
VPDSLNTEITNRPPTCGEAIVALLQQYGVDTVFGIPGFHNLELYRGLAHGGIRHILARNEQGAGFMADGYARSTGRPGVCFVISGPGVTNVSTALGQAYADSIPLLLISSSNASYTLGKGWGCLHETANQQGITEPITAFTRTAHSTREIPELIGQAFTLFASGRPRPVHISVPLDILAQTVTEVWAPRIAPERPVPGLDCLARAADLLAGAKTPVIVVGGGAAKAGPCVTELAEWLDAVVIASNAGKGVVPDTHPLSLGGGLIRREVRDHLARADVVLALGTELSATDSFIETLPITGALIRADIDPSKFNDAYPADIAVHGDAGAAAAGILAAVQGITGAPLSRGGGRTAAAVRARVVAGLKPVERQHKVVWDTLRDALPAEAVIFGDITQIVYTGSAVMPADLPRRWFYPAGFGTLGCAMPDAIGAKLAAPEVPVIAVVGDGGFMYTVQELMTAIEQRLPLPVVIWNNNCLAMIRDGMDDNAIPRIAIEPQAPDFHALAKAFGCQSAAPQSRAELAECVTRALTAGRPTLIVIDEGSGWLADA